MISPPAKRWLTSNCFYIVWGQFTGVDHIKCAASQPRPCWLTANLRRNRRPGRFWPILTDWCLAVATAVHQHTNMTIIIIIIIRTTAVIESKRISESYYFTINTLLPRVYRVNWKYRKKKTLKKKVTNRNLDCVAVTSVGENGSGHKRRVPIKWGLSSAQRSRLAVHHRTTQHPDKVNKTQRMRTPELQTHRKTTWSQMETLGLFILHPALRF